MNQKFGIGQVNLRHCVESIRIGRFSGPYSIQMQDNADQKNLEYRHFSLTGYHKQSQFNPFHETGLFQGFSKYMKWGKDRCWFNL